MTACTVASQVSMARESMTTVMNVKGGGRMTAGTVASQITQVPPGSGIYRQLWAEGRGGRMTAGTASGQLPPGPSKEEEEGGTAGTAVSQVPPNGSGLQRQQVVTAHLSGARQGLCSYLFGGTL